MTRPTGRDVRRRSIRALGTGITGALSLLVVALVGIGWALHHNLHTIDLLVVRLIEVEDPMRATAYEMEINVLGCGLGVWKYLRTGDQEHRERVQKDQADFRHFRAEYGRLAVSPVQRDLVDRLDALWSSYSGLCEALMATRDNSTALLSRVVAAIEEIDRIVDEQIQPGIDTKTAEGAAKLLSSTAIEADVAEMSASVGAYTADPNRQDRDRVFAATKEARDQVTAFLALPLTAGERAHGAHIEHLLDRAVAGIEDGLIQHRVLRDHAQTFIALRSLLDDVLDEGIQVLAQRDLAAAQPRARSTVDRLYAWSLFLLILGAVVVVGAIGLLTRRSVQLVAANLGLQEEIERRHAAEATRTRLFSQLVSVQEQERGRLARELHDQMGQNLAALKLGLNRLSRAVADAPVAAQLAELQAFAGNLVEQVHTIAWELRPAALDDIGIHGVLNTHLDEQSRRSGIEVDFESNLEGQRLPAPIEITLYRVAQEALTNVLKHAEARRVSVTMQRRDQEVVMVVEDDGRGFDPEVVRSGSKGKNHVGLLGMRERTILAGGVFEVESSPGAGTTLVVRFPITGPGRPTPP